MNIKPYDAILQTILVVALIIINGILLKSHLSFFIILSVVLLKVYQVIGGGGVHLWACHALGKDNLKSWLKPVILFFWVLCGIGRASHFCKYHILHHYHCDKEGDPHSPKEYGVFILTLGLWTLFTNKKEKFITSKIQRSIDESFKRINDNQIASFIDKNHYAILFVLLATSIAISPFFALYFVTLPMLLNIIDGNFFFVYYFHKGGEVRNTPWVDYWIFKSGYHKVHHRWLK